MFVGVVVYSKDDEVRFRFLNVSILSLPLSPFRLDFPHSLPKVSFLNSSSEYSNGHKNIYICRRMLLCQNTNSLYGYFFSYVFSSV